MTSLFTTLFSFMSHSFGRVLVFPSFKIRKLAGCMSTKILTSSTGLQFYCFECGKIQLIVLLLPVQLHKHITFVVVVVE